MHDHAKFPCPSCGHELAQSSAPAGARPPRERDLSVCFYCGALLVYESRNAIRLLNLADARELKPEQAIELARIQQSIFARNAAAARSVARN